MTVHNYGTGATGPTGQPHDVGGARRLSEPVTVSFDAVTPSTEKLGTAKEVLGKIKQAGQNVQEQASKLAKAGAGKTIKHAGLFFGSQGVAKQGKKIETGKDELSDSEVKTLANVKAKALERKANELESSLFGVKAERNGLKIESKTKLREDAKELRAEAKKIRDEAGIVSEDVKGSSKASRAAGIAAGYLLKGAYQVASNIYAGGAKPAKELNPVTGQLERPRAWEEKQLKKLDTLGNRLITGSKESAKAEKGVRKEARKAAWREGKINDLHRQGLRAINDQPGLTLEQRNLLKHALDSRINTMKGNEEKVGDFDPKKFVEELSKGDFKELKFNKYKDEMREYIRDNITGPDKDTLLKNVDNLTPGLLDKLDHPKPADLANDWAKLLKQEGGKKSEAGKPTGVRQPPQKPLPPTPPKKGVRQSPNKPLPQTPPKKAVGTPKGVHFAEGTKKTDEGNKPKGISKAERREKLNVKVNKLKDESSIEQSEIRDVFNDIMRLEIGAVFSGGALRQMKPVAEQHAMNFGDTLERMLTELKAEGKTPEEAFEILKNNLVKETIEAIKAQETDENDLNLATGGPFKGKFEQNALAILENPDMKAVIINFLSQPS